MSENEYQSRLEQQMNRNAKFSKDIKDALRAGLAAAFMALITEIFGNVAQKTGRALMDWMKSRYNL